MTLARRLERGLFTLLLLAITMQGISNNSAPGQEATEGLVAYWPFDEGEGAQVLDAAGGRFTSSACGAQRVPGWKGQALQFDGIEGYVRVEAGKDLALQDALTLAAWLRLDQLPPLQFRNDFRFILGKPDLKPFSLVVEATGVMNGSIWSSGNRLQARSPEPLPLGTWTHVAFTYDAATGVARLFINGTLVSEQQGKGGPVDANTSALLIGSTGHRLATSHENRAGQRSFLGAIDEARIYNRALSPVEVQQLSSEASAPAQMPTPIPVRFEVVLEKDRPNYSRIIIRSQDGCPEILFTDPVKSASTRQTSSSASLIGQAEISLLPGLYTVTVDHGGGFTGEPFTKTITVSSVPGPGNSLVVQFPEPALTSSAPQGNLTPVGPLLLRFDPRQHSYYSADLHIHTYASGDGVTPMATSVLAQLAADLDLAFISDHNTADGHTLFVEEASRHGMPLLLSEEITTESWGHFNAYPLRSGEFVGVSPDKTPAEYFAEARAKGASVIQVNHPYWGGGEGYFKRMNDLQFDRGFDAMEVINGFEGRLGELYQLARPAIFELWNQGLPVTAVGGSDDHSFAELVAQVGWPRTYVYVEGELTAERWLAGLKAQRAFVTSGPLVYLHVQGQALPGSHLRLKSGEPLRFDVELQSIPELRALHLWKNGREVRTFTLSGHTALLSWEETVQEAGWYAVTVDADSDGVALTNPIWIELQGSGQEEHHP